MFRTSLNLGASRSSSYSLKRLNDFFVQKKKKSNRISHMSKAHGLEITDSHMAISEEVSGSSQSS